MTKQEFETLSGKRVCDMEYTYIEEMYMKCDNMNKQEFCAHYGGVASNPIFGYFYDRCRELEIDINNQGLATEVVAFDLIQKSVKSDDEDLRSCAIALIGEKRYLIYKLDKDLPLSSLDMRLLREIL